MSSSSRTQPETEHVEKLLLFQCSLNSALLGISKHSPIFLINY